MIWLEDLESGRQLIPFDPAKFFYLFLGLEESGYDGADIKPEKFKPWSVSNYCTLFSWEKNPGGYCIC